MGFVGKHSLAVHLTTFAVWTVGVAVVTFFICRAMSSGQQEQSASEEFFAGGRSLPWYVVSGSLMLTNLSTEQLVGLNGTVFKDGCMVGSAWETFAAFAMCITATVFLPRYQKSGLTTTTGFLGERFDTTVRTIVACVFLVFYACVLCPMVLYTGALAFQNMFDLQNIPLWMVSTFIGFVGACYALFGGLRAVAVSDCLNGVGLIIVGLWVPIAGLTKIGGLSGFFAEENADHLKALAATCPVRESGGHARSEAIPTLPWHVNLTGMMLMQLYYWSTNQLIVQRALAAVSLAEGQKGVLFAAIMKVVGFTFLCVPGVLAIIMERQEVLVDGKPFTVEKTDTAYPKVVRAVMPIWCLGFFAAVLLGSVLSTFNSCLQSASTLFGLEIYKVYIAPEADDDRTVNVATGFGVSLTLLSFVIAPQFSHIETIFDFLQKLKTMASLPIISIFLLGISTLRPDAFAAKCGIAAGGLAYVVGVWPGALLDMHYLHSYFLCFVVAAVVTMLAADSRSFRDLMKCFAPGEEPEHCGEESGKAVVDSSPWKAVYRMCLIVCILVVLVTVSL
eukprot:CAMPEP_0179186336 /NCGR_PEP_ID=MMETSP0796-20121207/92418_1 /TAXON_ID=73915 /ORGANISM="Pyrodinium bahamense, Strain pbaha01" /LENGTH=560 /DNA_ID=CAMNT_0020890325 /DNA_START=302 /DNA_END=1980 /DNA_ORIENTATION=-